MAKNLTCELLNLPLFVFFIILLFPSASSISFNKPRFAPDDNNIVYQGDATPSVGAIELINKYRYTCRVGLVTYANMVQLWDSDTGKISDFNTRFSFSIDTLGNPIYGHGLAFFLAPVGFQIPLNSAGGFLGLFNTTTIDSSSNQIVMVEFDSFKNVEWDPSDVEGHVGINKNSLFSAVYTRWNASFHSGDTADVQITYNSTTKNLSVSWSFRETSTSVENTSLFYIIDLMKILPERVTVGFSAATGIYTTRHMLESWEFNSSLDVKIKTNEMDSQKIRIIVGVTVSAGVLIAGLIAGFLILRRLKQAKANNTETVNLTSINDDLERGEFLLAYEFMPNGSLDSHLFGKKSPLTWAVRYKISLGLASALLYLHEEWEQCVVHRDIKSSNIMLDSSFNVKLGDFGLARLMDHELGPQTTGLAGTLGYLAPEYIRTGRASKESDVYSFGVVALEIATGKKSVDPAKENSEMGLVEWAWDVYGKGKLLSGVDKNLNIDFDEQQMECLMIVGLWCAHPDRNFRPSIRQAIQVLNFETAVPNLPSTMPVPMYHVPSLTVSSNTEPLITNSSIEVGR
ncbi:hypothetical protein LWI29_001847 [Acer saccharum]|uniref:Protein kinase domain-containing protein n=1 Tax=Acer saccharum TaxID=4024 RepID=A0AA39W497_ACESA|nr:hypothetical protein LWI29_001847 [Acer saccharum]